MGEQLSLFEDFDMIISKQGIQIFGFTKLNEKVVHKTTKAKEGNMKVKIKRGNLK